MQRKKCNIIMMNSQQTKKIKKRKEKFIYEFKDFLHNYLVALSSGDAYEKGILTCYEDLIKIYKETDYIIIFLNQLINKQKIGINICNGIEELANETSIEEIINFSNAFIICYKAGGDILSLLRNNIEILENKFEIKEKIKEIFSEKKYEMKIISTMPMFMILILNLTANEYMKVFYTNVKGYLIITISILFNLIGFKLASRMTNNYE